MPKIAYLTPMYFSDDSYIGGGERYPTNLARGVVEASRGEFAVDLISFGAEQADVDLGPGVRLRVLRAAAKPDNALDVLSWDIPAALAEVDLVHVHQAHSRCGEVGLLVAKGLRKPICVTDHGGETSRVGRQYGITELADRIVAQSAFAASFFEGKTPVEVFNGGVDSIAFRPPDAPSRRDYVLFVGRLLPHKGVDRLIRALPDGLALRICGRPYRPEYFRVLRELAVGKDVTFLTDADDARVLDLYQHALVGVLPSVHRDHYGDYYAAPELMGLAVLEALACGTPAIGSNLAAIPEFIEPGETGFVFDDEAELSARLAQLAADPGLVERLGANGRRAVESRYSTLVVGGRLVGLYRRLLANAAGVAA